MELSSKKVFVAFLDILGFKSYVLKNNVEKVIRDITELFSLSANIAVAHVSTARYNLNVDEGNKVKPTEIVDYPDGSQKSLLNLSVSNINSILLFDSIVLWTQSGEESDLIDLLSVIRFMLNSHLFFGLPLRGAISYGEFCFQDIPIMTSSVTKHSALVSAAQIRAMSLEKQQEWSGCVLDQSVILRCREINLELDNNKLLLITKYPVPMKNNITEDLYSIVWGVTTNPRTKKFCNVEQSVKSTWPMPQDQNIIKINNTIKFIEFCCQVIEENQWD